MFIKGCLLLLFKHQDSVFFNPLSCPVFSLIRTVFKSVFLKKFAREMFQDYQLTLMINMKMRTLRLTYLSKHSKLLALIFQWKECRGKARLKSLLLLVGVARAAGRERQGGKLAQSLKVQEA